MSSSFLYLNLLWTDFFFNFWHISWNPLMRKLSSGVGLLIVCLLFILLPKIFRNNLDFTLFISQATIYKNTSLFLIIQFHPVQEAKKMYQQSWHFRWVLSCFYVNMFNILPFRLLYDNSQVTTSILIVNL